MRRRTVKHIPAGRAIALYARSTVVWATNQLGDSQLGDTSPIK